MGQTPAPQRHQQTPAHQGSAHQGSTQYPNAGHLGRNPGTDASGSNAVMIALLVGLIVIALAIVVAIFLVA
jgi:serine/threonine-protein kinase